MLLDDVRADADLAVVADRIVSALARPFLVPDASGHHTSCVIGASVGIARGSGPATTVDALLRNADLALYEAKARGRGQHAFFDPTMPHETA